MEKIVIFDSGIPKGGENKIFDRAFASRISHTLLPMCYLTEELAKLGITSITPDVFLSSPQLYKDKQVLLLSHLVSPFTEELIAHGVTPLLMTCQESPFIATRFFINLRRYTALFKNVMLFPGMKKRASEKTNFIPMYFPEYFVPDTTRKSIPFSEKKFMVYIASNKETKNLVKTFIIKILYGFNVQLIYALRRKMIRHFSDTGNDFDLYGRGWQNEQESYIAKVYKGEVDDKEAMLRGYKFVLCLENAVFPGYITEKIFDCFFAGAVPIYIGAPDASLYIPKNTYIDVRDFKTLTDLDQYLRTMSEDMYNEYLKNIQVFLASPSYAQFSHTVFAEKVVALVQAA